MDGKSEKVTNLFFVCVAGNWECDRWTVLLLKSIAERLRFRGWRGKHKRVMLA
jgi:hypothetical protein